MRVVQALIAELKLPLLIALSGLFISSGLKAEQIGDFTILRGKVIRHIEFFPNRVPDAERSTEAVHGVEMSFCEQISTSPKPKYVFLIETVSDADGNFEFVLDKLEPNREYALCMVGWDGNIITQILGIGAKASEWLKPSEFVIPPRTVVTREPCCQFENRGIEYSGVDVFFATDRAVILPDTKNETQKSDEGGVPTSDKGVVILNKNDSNGALTYGLCSVEVEPGTGGQKLTTGFTRAYDPHTYYIEELYIYSQRDMWNVFSSRLTNQTGHDALLFIHGYNSSFYDSCRRAAQIAYELKFSGPILLYSWPSHNSTLSYAGDEEMAEWSEPHFAEFLKQTLDRKGLGHLHIIAHSMGNRVLANALFSSNLTAEEQSRLGQVIFAAPDINRLIFDQQISLMKAKAGRMTLYASSLDQALLLSKIFHGYSRAGDSNPTIDVQSGVDSIDASAVDTSLIGHSYIGDSRSVLADISVLISDNKDPDKRFGLLRHGSPPKLWWAIVP